MSKQKKFSDLLPVEIKRLLAEVAFLAAGYGLYQQANQIFQFLELVCKGQAYPTLGKALAFLNQGEPQKAIQLLEGKLATGSGINQDEIATLRCFLGLALNFAGDNRAGLKQLKLAHSQKSSDPQIRNLAEEIAKQQTSNR